MVEPSGHCTIWQQYTGTLYQINTSAEKSNNLHEWTPCEGWCNCSCSRVRLSKQGAIFEPVVSHLISICDVFDHWDTKAEEFWQSGITSFPCRNYLSVASLMYQICFVQLWLIFIICDFNRCTCICSKSTNIDQLWDSGGDWGVGSRHKLNHIFP